PDTQGTSSGHALVLETLDLSETLPSSGSFAATVGVTVQGNDGDGDVFVGIGPAADVARYLDHVQVDRIVQVNWPGGMRTETEPGTRRPKPPDTRPFWVAKTHGSPATLTWPVAAGDWTLVIMNASAAAPVSVIASGSITLPALGPIGIGLLVAGLVILVGGVLLTISGAKTPSARKGVPPPRPDEPAPGIS
ncbi:MAG: hypothetical protein M3P43_02295, partial [Actinomycetota bacterium]|nr:hypothetical protein [Actinomycetota bacterium]